jgi:nicotinamide-nucleotide amidase
MRTEILSIGYEVLDGQTQNTNAAFLGRALSEKGYEIAGHRVVADGHALIIDSLKEALSRSDFVIATGGLGPTIDDLTKKAAADLFKAPLEIDQELYAELKTRYPDSDDLKNQALVPKGAIVLKNRVGSASGLLFLREKGLLFLLPGPPREMEPMFEEQVQPLLEQHFPLVTPPTMLRLSLCMLRELDVDPILREIEKENPDVQIGIYPSYGTLQVRFKIAKQTERLALWAERIRQAFPAHLYEGASIAEALHRILIEKGKTLALAESCTGGAISERLTAMADASKYLFGSLVVYTNEWKQQFLDVKEETLQRHGAVSRETVVEMVQGLFAKTEADYAIAVSGIAGPTGGSAEKPVGTVYIAVGQRGGVIDAGSIRMQPFRSSVIEQTVQTSLGALYRRLAYNKESFS